MPAARSRTEVLAFLALLVMTAAWGSTFFLIKDVVLLGAAIWTCGEAYTATNYGH